MALDETPSPEEKRRHSELRDAIDRIAEVAAVKAARRTAKRAARGYFLLVVFLLIGATVYSRVQENRLHTGLMAACKRVNTLRVEESNRNAQVMYAALFQARKRERGLARRVDPKGLHQASVDYLDVSIRALRWTPETSCRKAVDRASTYVRPTPKQFERRFLDLSVVPK